MRQYQKIKESGVEWLDKVPAHWDIKRLKQITTKIGSGVTPSGGSESYQENGIPLFRSQNIHSDGLRLDDVAFISPEVNESMKNSQVKFGDVLLNITGASIGRCFFYEGESNQANVNQHVCIIRSNGQVTSRYLQLIMSSDFGQHQIDISQNGASREGLTFTQLKDFLVPVPPLSEQQAIAAYLDSKTAQLGTLLAQKQTLLVILQRKRQALINEAVTQGLDRLTPRKSSGVEWLGDVPAHWDVKKLKYLFSASLGGGTPDTTNDNFWNGDIPWVSPKDMKVPVISATQDYVTDLAVKSSSTNMIPKNSVMVVVRSGILKHTFPVAINAIPVALNQDMKAFVPNSLISAEYLAQLLKGFQQHILNQCTKIGATVDSIEMDWLYGFPFPVPPREEQEQIVSYLDASNKNIKEATTAIQTQIDTLKAYRQALISEVVTGKVDVHPAAAAPPASQQLGLFA